MEQVIEFSIAAALFVINGVIQQGQLVATDTSTPKPLESGPESLGTLPMPQETVSPSGHDLRE